MIKKPHHCSASIVLLLGLTSILFFALAHPAAGQEVTLRLEPETVELAPGDEAVLEIKVENIEQLAGAEFHLTFDPILLEIVDQNASEKGVQIAHGDFLSPDFVAQNLIQLDKGTIDYAIACMPVEKAVSGSGTLARVTVRALSEGKTIVDIHRSLLSNPQGQPIGTTTESSVVTISRRRLSPTTQGLVGITALAVVSGLGAVIWRTVKAR